MLACAFAAAAQNLPLNIVFFGDSLTEGVPHLSGESDTYAFMVGQSFAGSTYTKLAYRGQTTDVLLRQIGVLFPLYKQGFSNALVLWAGTNDCAAGPLDCATPVYANLTAMAGAARAAGWYVVGVTLIARGSYFADEAHEARFAKNRALLNGWLRKSSAFDAVADPSGALNDAGDTNYFWDQCHLMPSGYTVVADKIVQAIRSLPLSR